MFGAHVWRRDPPCARRCNKEYLLNSPLTIESSTPAFYGIKGEARAEYGLRGLSEVEGHAIKEVNPKINKYVSRKGTVQLHQIVIGEELPDHKIPICILTDQQKHTNTTRQCTTDTAQFLKSLIPVLKKVCFNLSNLSILPTRTVHNERS